MWTRAELKSRAKACLKKYYWMAFLASLIAGLLGGASGGGNSSGVNFQSAANAAKGNAQFDGAVRSFFDGANSATVVAFLMILGVVLLVAWVIALSWSIFFGNMIQVGSCRYFMESREKQESAGLGRLFYGFTCGHYMNVVKVMFLRNLFISLWTLLLIIPGIIKTYEYYMVPYIMSENPEMSYRDALDLSKRMMQGEKWNTFVLQLSFIGWEILGGMCCGIGLLFVAPYINATMAELYAELRGRVRYEERY